MLVLEGRQGTLKSSALRALVGDEWFSDALPNMGTKDASSYLRGRWVIEVAELEAMRRDMDTIKAYISRQVETYRPAYGREEVTEPRRCIFAGTTNKSDWLNDETGGRRFWPVKVGFIDLNAIRCDRDQLWAEAANMFRSGERWWLDSQMADTAADVVRQRAVDDPWRDDIARAIHHEKSVTTKKVLASMGVEIRDMSPALSKRVAAELTKLGWTRQTATSGTDKGRVIFTNEQKGRDCDES